MLHKHDRKIIIYRHLVTIFHKVGFGILHGETKR